MTRAIAGAVVLGTAVAACFSTPTRPGDGTGDSGVTGDGKLIDSLSVDAMLNIDGNPSSCETDNFVGSGSGSCGQYLTMSNNFGMAYLSNTSSGELQLSLYGGTGSFVNCTSTNGAWNRVTAELIDPAASGPANHTFLGLQSMDGQSRWGIDVADSGGTPAVSSVCDGGGGTSTIAPWNILKHRFVKVERVGTDIAISVSGNNMAFEPLTHCLATADLTTTQAQLRAYSVTTGSGSSTSTSDLASFGFVELCQD